MEMEKLVHVVTSSNKIDMKFKVLVVCVALNEIQKRWWTKAISNWPCPFQQGQAHMVILFISPLKLCILCQNINLLTNLPFGIMRA